MRTMPSSRSTLHRLAALLLGALCITAALGRGPLSAQSPLEGPRTNDPDVRDVVTLEKGELKGRVINPFDPDEIVLVQKGKRRRIPRQKIQKLHLLRDDMRVFLERRRSKRSGDAEVQWGWLLVEWAHSKGLFRMAELQAMELALRFGHGDSHRYLGNRKKNDTWLWPHKGGWHDYAGLEEAIRSWGNGITIRSEHFSVRCNGGVAMAVHALIDLEALYLWWGDTFGAALDMREVRTVMPLQVHRDKESFPRWGNLRMPWFDPDPSGDVVRTHVDSAGTRPERLFQCGSWLILWHAVALDPQVQDEQERINPWLEMGLSGYAQMVFEGPPGLAAPRAEADPKRECLRAANFPIRLQTHVQLPIYAGYYLAGDRETRQRWAVSATLATWLLEHNGPKRREAFLRYAKASLRQRKGTSSTLWKRQLGVSVATLEGPWRGWVRGIAGI